MSATIISMEDFNAAAQQAEQAARFVRRPVSVLVHWSESGAWQEEETVPFAEFEARALSVAMSHADRGYLKTKVTVTFDDGDTYGARLDLAAGDTLGFAHHCLGMIRFFETEKGRDYYHRMDSIDLIDFVKAIDFGAAVAQIAEQERDAALAVQIAREKAEEAQRAADAENERAYKAEIARLKTAPEFAYLAQIGSGASGKEVAKNIRAQLKNAFAKDYQGCKFSVRCQRGGWSTAIYVRWTDGPTREQVRDVLDAFKGGYFDAMQDMYEHVGGAFNEVFGSVDYLSIDRDMSEELRALAAQLVANEGSTCDFGRAELEATRRISIAANGPLLDGKPWPIDSQQEQSNQAPALRVVHVESVPVVEQKAKPKFTAVNIGGRWFVIIEQDGEINEVHNIEAASMVEACRIAWATLQDSPTPPDDDPDGGLPLPVEPLAEDCERTEQGATAPTNTRAALLGDYRGRQEAKRDRLEERADKAANASENRHAQVRSILSWIVPGQPILIGHHSEARHRRDLARVDRNMGQAVALAKKAERLTRRAETVGQGGIASDDPEALALLREKLAARERKLQAMKEANKLERGTYRAWQLSNNNAEIRRLRQRIEQVEKLHSAAPIEQTGNGWHMFEDEGRIQIHFDGKPAPEIRQLCKGAGFVWSPSRCSWVRKVTARAVKEAHRLARALPAAL